MNLKPGHLILVALGIIVAGLLGLALGRGSMKAACQAEAVKTGHAQYKVVDEYGQVAFEWLPNHGPEKPMQQPSK